MRVVVGTVLTIALAIASVVVLKGDSEEPGSAGSTDGEAVFLASGCVGCHRLGARPANLDVGPALTNVEVGAGARVEGLTAAEYIRQSIREPGAYIVPGYGLEMPTLPLTDEEVDALVEFLLQPDE